MTPFSKLVSSYKYHNDIAAGIKTSLNNKILALSNQIQSDFMSEWEQREYSLDIKYWDSNNLYLSYGRESGYEYYTKDFVIPHECLDDKEVATKFLTDRQNQIIKEAEEREVKRLIQSQAYIDKEKELKKQKEIETLRELAHKYPAIVIEEIHNAKS